MSANLVLDWDRDLVRVSGPDAIGYLQGQISQDVESLAIGGVVWSFLLEPTGKLEALMRLSRLGEQDLLIDVDPGRGSVVLDSLRRFRLRSQVEIEPWDAAVVAVRGPEPVPLVGEHGVLVDDDGVAGADIIGAPDELVDAAAQVGAEESTWWRLRTGRLVDGVELVPGAIPNETGWVAAAASVTKGCYRGQELVERIDSRGAERFRVRRLRSVGGDVPSPGSAVFDPSNEPGKSVGEILASAPGQWGLASARVRGAVKVGSTVSADGVEMLVEETPLPGSSSLGW